MLWISGQKVAKHRNFPNYFWKNRAPVFENKSIGRKEMIWRLAHLGLTKCTGVVLPAINLILPSTRLNAMENPCCSLLTKLCTQTGGCVLCRPQKSATGLQFFSTQK